MSATFYGVASMPKSRRIDIANHQKVPGPGSYDSNLEKTQHGLPKWSLKKRLEQGGCFQDTSITPGPGNYQHPQGFKKLPPTILSTKGEKYRNYVEKAYPHSSLNLPGSLNLKGGAAFGCRDAVKEADRSPGPVYHLDSIIEKKRHQKSDSRLKGFGGEKKNIYNQDSQSPGPGSFSPDAKDAWTNKTSEAWTIGGSKRTELPPSTELGPGQYNPSLSSTLGRSFKMRGRNEQKSVEANNLGPGSYEIPSTKTKLGTKFSSPRQQQYGDDENEARPDQILSPSSYSPPRYLEQANSQGYSLGKRLDKRENFKGEEPGPGTYEVAQSYVQGNGGYMGRKREGKKRENLTTDNFYKYDPNLDTVARESPKFSFPQGRRDKENAQQASGYSQCFYQSLDKKSGGYSYSMGTSKRFGGLRKESGPFREREAEYGAMGQMPGYLRKRLRQN